MENTSERAIAIVGVGAILPDAPNVTSFWANIKNGRYSVTEVQPDRWDPNLYYDPDPHAPDKTYSKIGGWIRDYPWDPIKWRLPIPPRVADAMDGSQKWAIACTREALEDFGYPKRPLDPDRTAVILGNAMGGERHYFTVLRAYFPEYARELTSSASFVALPPVTRDKILYELHERMGKHLPEITEDSMPGELANCIAGRIANVFNFHGPNFVCDAACASAMAAISAAAEGLIHHDYDVAITGGIDRNMGASTFVKFCKIGALSATGTRPYAEGADGFVMGEGAAVFLMKRLADAERDGDKIYAVLRGMGGSSDGKGKGITAPNPAGQKFAIERAWKNAGLSPATATYIEGHGTSTRVGDVVEVQSMVDVLGGFHLASHSVALGSVKSNFGHLKGAAGAAGLLKLTLALRDKVLPPSVHCEHPNPDIDFAHSPLYVNTELRAWDVPADSVRRAGLSAFGFGGTNFHAVVEEYIPHRLNGNGKRTIAVTESSPATETTMMAATTSPVQNSLCSYKAPLRGALVIGAASDALLIERLRAIEKEAKQGVAPAPSAPAEADLQAPERIAIDYANAEELATKSATALKALSANQPAMWKALRAQGIFRGHGPRPKVAFLYPGQGSQYVNMLQPLLASEPIVAETFKEADQVMTPILGKPLSEFIFVDRADAAAVSEAEDALRQTAITQPAVLATDLSLTRLLAAYGIEPDFTMGHSLGEYGALIAAGGLPFADALEAVAARGREMTRYSPADKGRMAAVFAPLEEIERILKTVSGYVVIANINSEHQSVIGGASLAVEKATAALISAGYEVTPLPVSHAFHTSIVAPASEPLRQVLERLHLQSPRLPIVANINGEFYPMGQNVVPQMLDILAKQVAAPVQFIKGLRTLYAAGARMFVEVGPKKALHGFAEDVLGANGDVISIFTNHPKTGDIAAFNQALCCLYAAGFGFPAPENRAAPTQCLTEAARDPKSKDVKPAATAAPPMAARPSSLPQNGDRLKELGLLFAEVLERGWEICHGLNPAPSAAPVVITGAALGLPGTDHVFDDDNIARILGGDQFINTIPVRFRQLMLDKHITRLVKSDNGGPTFETINNIGDVIKLAGRAGKFNLEAEFGVPGERVAALDRVTQLAIAAGIDALRDAGIPLVLRYKTTSKGTLLPDRWALPDALRDDTGVIFASAFPGLDSFSDEMRRYYEYHARLDQLAALESLRARANGNGTAGMVRELDGRIEALRATIEKEPYVFERRFLLRTLSMGHSQFAEFIGARGPNTQVNAACASTTQAVALAEDWIHAGRCSRVIVISSDDVTSDHLMEWMGAGFLASGAAATDEVVTEAAVPFDRRRHGLIVGMGAAALVVERASAAKQRGIQPICEVISTVTNNSAFHGTRLDVQHIGQVMETLIANAEARTGATRQEIAPQTVFVSHETYTPARGGSASAEIHALRKVFGDMADRIVIANTKGLTGHAMGTGIEDVVAVKALETGLVPPVANFKEVDPELGSLNLSKGGAYPVEYALHLGAGFGSQISMMLLRWVKTTDGARRDPNALGYSYRIADAPAWNSWLSSVAGQSESTLEVIHRTLRIHDQQQPTQVGERSEARRPVAAQVSTVPASTPVSIPKAKKTAPPPAVTTQTVVQVPVATPISTSLPAAPKAVDDVREKVLALVSEKTGYPVDMLDLDLDLEADLGVDTVKQAEVFAAIRETYDILRDENRKLRDYPTLAHVIRFVYEKRPDLTQARPAPVQTAMPQVTELAPPKAQIGFTPEPAASPAAAAASDSVKERVLALVVEKTGYPQDMLDLDLDLEADLGVDTVKQAEMFSAIREIYNIPRDENRKLRDYPTLAHVVRFVYENRPDLAIATPAPAQITTERTQQQTSAAVIPAPATSPAPDTSADPVKERVVALVVEKTGYPQDMLDLDLDLEADLGVDTVKQAEMFAAIREIYNIPRDENRKLRDYPTLAHVIRFVYESRPDLAMPTAPVEVAAASPPVITEEPVATTKTDTPVAAALEVRTSQNDRESVEERVLALVVEKTGYPKEMLDLDLDLEADLGVDTVKQAEMFAAIREIYNIPRDQNRKLRDYPTLAHVIRFVFENRPDLAVPVTPASVVEFPFPVPPVPTQVAAPAQNDSADSIHQKVLAIVAEKTGYPTDMLDPDLDLEADLGIDTVKQAEMFAAIRAAYNIPRDENLKLRDFPTLAHVVRFAQERAQIKNVPEHIPAAPKPTGPVPPSSGSQQEQPRPVPASFDAANRIPRRAPIPVLRPPLSACKTSGVTLERDQRVVIMPDKGGVADALAQLLQTKGVEVLRIQGIPNAEALMDCLKKWKASGPISGVYWLPALDQETDLGKMEPATWHDAVRLRLKSLYTTMRTLYDDIAKSGTFLTCGTRMGGQHGYDEAGALAPLGGSVTGFAKTYKRERPDCFVKAVDFELECSAPEVAQLLIDETLRDPGAIEVGYKGGLRWAIGLKEQSAVDGQPGLTLDENTVFVVTGAAGSIVSAITADLATASGGTFYLLDLVPEPDPNNPDLKRFATDKDGLKRDLFTRIQERGERATPALVEKELAALERAQAALNAIDAVRTAGGKPYYFSVNLADTDGVAKVMDAVRQRNGHIDLLLHAAGLERSRPLADKDAREFDLVFDVKADGFFNLLHGIGDMPLGATVAFSSIAGRFGNPGQTDYSSANDLLCKITSSFRTTRPKTRGIAIDWTAWGGIGMATRGSIPKVMEQAGIDMLPPEAGVPLIRRELTTGGTRGEVVIGERLGVLLKEWDETGGLDGSAAEASLQAPTSSGPMIGKIARAGLFCGLTFETTLDPKTQPFLHDHQISGTPVLPGVMGIEAFTEAALRLLPGWRIKAVEGVDFLAPFKFYRSDSRVVTVDATIHPDGDEVLAHCRLIGRRTLSNHPEPQITTHFTGRVRLTKLPVDLTPGMLPNPSDGLSIDAADIYRVYFHGPAYQVLEKAWWDGSRMIGLFATDLPSNHFPPELPTQASPRWIELCFQTAGLWEMGTQERMGLPNHIDSVSFGLSSPSTNGRFYAIVTPDPVRGTFDAEVVDAKGNRFVHLSGYRTIATPISVNAEQVKVLRALLSPSPVAA